MHSVTRAVWRQNSQSTMSSSSAVGTYPIAKCSASVAHASVGVVPNLPIRLNRFALSSKLLEYVALEIPAVCADLPTLRAHFTHDEVTFFKAGDAEALADAIVGIARDPAGARRRARTRFDGTTTNTRGRRVPRATQRFSAVASGVNPSHRASRTAHCALEEQSPAKWAASMFTEAWSPSEMIGSL